MRSALIALSLAACSFDPAGVAGGGGDPPDARVAGNDGSPDASSIDGAPGPPDATPPDAMATCPGTYTPSVTGSAYRMIQGPQESWTDAAADCADDGAPYTSLAIIDDDAENTFLDGFTSNRNVWFGITDAADEGEWRDLDGAPVGFDPWGPFEPNNGGNPQNDPGEDCGQLLDGGAWNDLPCSDTLRYVCECDLAP